MSKKAEEVNQRLIALTQKEKELNQNDKNYQLNLNFINAEHIKIHEDRIKIRQELENLSKKIKSLQKEKFINTVLSYIYGFYLVVINL